VSNYSSNTVSAYRNTATSGTISIGSLATKVDFATGAVPCNVAMGDIDGDSKPDLITANYNSNTVSVLRNIASSGSFTSGSFATKIDFATGTNPRFVAVGDIDGDGMPDLAVGNFTSNNVSVLWNDPGHLAPPSGGSDGSISLCVGGTVTLNDAVPGGTWSSSNSHVAQVDETTGVVKGMTLGRAEITYSAGAVNDVTKVVVNPLPGAITLTAIPGSSIQPGQNVTLTAAVQHDGAILTYQWLVNGVTIAGANGATYSSSKFANNDLVTCVVGSRNCNDYSVSGSVRIKVNGAIIGKNGVLAGSAIQVVPNPNNGSFVIRGTLAAGADDVLSVEITDMLGRVIYTDQFATQNGNVDQAIKLSNVQNGMYIVTLRTGAENRMFHIVIEQ
jgi:FG-GAP-like repeat/Secretion system C-terminal sorting domain/Bacterial Ig-like domain (group 2)